MENQLKLTALIVDDEKPARDRLKRLLASINVIELIGQAENAEEAMELIKNYQPALVFLDISMPAMNGIQLANWLQQQNFSSQVIFTTAYDEYALEAFEVNAKDYLLKPIRSERLVAAIKKFLPKQNQQPFIVLKDASSTHKVALADIIYLHADHKYTEVHLTNKKYLTTDSLKEFEQKYPNLFMRIHRSTLINKHFLLGIENKQDAMHVILKEIDAKPKVSRRHQSELRKHLKT